MTKHPTKRVTCEASLPGPGALSGGRSPFLGHPRPSLSRTHRSGEPSGPVGASVALFGRRLDLLRLLMDARSNLLELSMNMGLEILGVMLEEDRNRLCGPKGHPDRDREATRYG